jgi:hypothetical protein
MGIKGFNTSANWWVSPFVTAFNKCSHQSPTRCLNGRSSLATVEELLLTTAVGEATARPIGYASVAETEELVEVLPPPQPLKKRVRQKKLKNFLFS